MKMNNVARGLLLISALQGVVLNAESEKIVLKSGVLKLLDGVPFGLDGATIADMIHVRREVRKIQFGVQDKQTKKFEGIYSFDGQMHSIHSLACYERALEKEYTARMEELDGKHIKRSAFTAEWHEAQNKIDHAYEKELSELGEKITRHPGDDDEMSLTKYRLQRKLFKKYEKEKTEQHRAIKQKHISNPGVYDTERSKIQAEWDGKLKPLKECLKVAKADFNRVTAPFMDRARGTKALMFKLIEESCQRRGRYDSFLLEWGEEEEGSEMIAFEQNMNSCQRLDRFCADLTNFMEDIINSCPKGMEQFRELAAQHART